MHLTEYQKLCARCWSNLL